MRQEEFNWFVFQAVVALGLLALARSYWQQFQRAWRNHGSADGSTYLLELAGVAGTGRHDGWGGLEDFPGGGKAERRRKGGGQRPGAAAATGRGGGPAGGGGPSARRAGRGGGPGLGAAGGRAAAPQLSPEAARSAPRGGGRQLSALELLQTASSGSSGPPSDAGLLDEDAARGSGLDVLDLGAGGTDSQRTNDELSTGRVCLLHDVRPGKTDMSEGVSSSLAVLSKELFGKSVWEVVSKKNKLRVTGCLRWNGDGYETLGLAIYRLQQHVLQVVFLGVAVPHRGHGVGRSLVRALREVAKGDQLCLSIAVLLPAPVAEDPRAGGNAGPEGGSLPFWRAVGFRRCDLKGLLQGQVCLKIEVRKFGKRQRRQMEKSGQPASGQTAASHELLSWSDVLAAAPKAAAAAAEPASFLRLPPPPRSSTASRETAAALGAEPDATEEADTARAVEAVPDAGATQEADGAAGSAEVAGEVEDAEASEEGGEEDGGSPSADGAGVAAEGLPPSRPAPSGAGAHAEEEKEEEEEEDEEQDVGEEAEEEKVYEIALLEARAREQDEEVEDDDEDAEDEEEEEDAEDEEEEEERRPWPQLPGGGESEEDEEAEEQAADLPGAGAGAGAVEPPTPPVGISPKLLWGDAEEDGVPWSSPSAEGAPPAGGPRLAGRWRAPAHGAPPPAGPAAEEWPTAEGDSPAGAAAAAPGGLSPRCSSRGAATGSEAHQETGSAEAASAANEEEPVEEDPDDYDDEFAELMRRADRLMGGGQQSAPPPTAAAAAPARHQPRTASSGWVPTLRIAPAPPSLVASSDEPPPGLKGKGAAKGWAKGRPKGSAIGKGR